MKTSTKAGLYVFLIFAVIYVIVRFSIQAIFSDINQMLLAVATAIITIILTPQRRIVKKQSGDEIQLKWLFNKKVIILK
jgi:low affinity Fe/Cu permease